MKFTVGEQSVQRKRVVSAQHTRRHGDIEPIVYLHALMALAQDDASVLTSRRPHVPDDLIDAQVNEHREVFQALVDTFS